MGRTSNTSIRTIESLCARRLRIRMVGTSQDITDAKTLEEPRETRPDAFRPERRGVAELRAQDCAARRHCSLGSRCSTCSIAATHTRPSRAPASGSPSSRNSPRRTAAGRGSKTPLPAAPRWSSCRCGSVKSPFRAEALRPPGRAGWAAAIPVSDTWFCQGQSAPIV